MWCVIHTNILCLRNSDDSNKTITAVVIKFYNQTYLRSKGWSSTKSIVDRYQKNNHNNNNVKKNLIWMNKN